MIVDSVNSLEMTTLTSNYEKSKKFCVNVKLLKTKDIMKRLRGLDLVRMCREVIS